MIAFVELYNKKYMLNPYDPSHQQAVDMAHFPTKARSILAFVLAGLLSACAATPPTQEMSEARQSVEAAKQAGAGEHAPKAMDNAQQLLTKAEEGMRSGNYEEAQQDAIAAREAARQALALSEIKQTHEAPLPTTPPARSHEVVKTTPAVATITYQVQAGESLWSIAARPEVYGDPLLWPLIFKDNHANIADADLIFPGQRFRIDTAPGAEARSLARAHALQRGEWHLGETELSDARYLSQTGH